MFLARWWDQSRSPIGMDLGTHSVKLIQLQRQRDGLAVAAAACVSMPADLPEAGEPRIAALADLIRRAIEQGGFQGRSVVSSLPAANVEYKILRLPRMPEQELAEAVRWEASGRLQSAGADAVVQFLDAGEIRQGEEFRQEIILMGAPLGQVQEHVRMIEACGLRPLAIDAPPAALARALANLPATTGQPSDEPGSARFVLDVGHTCSKALVVRGGQVAFFKIIPVGGRNFDQAVAQRLNLSPTDAAELRLRLHQRPAEGVGDERLFGSSRRENVERAVFEALRGTVDELAREVGLCMRYYSVTFRGRRPGGIVLTGGQSNQPHLAKVLSEDGGLHIEPAPLPAAASEAVAALLAMPAAQGNVWTLAGGLAQWSDAAAQRGAA